MTYLLMQSFPPCSRQLFITLYLSCTPHDGLKGRRLFHLRWIHCVFACTTELALLASFATITTRKTLGHGMRVFLLLVFVRIIVFSYICSIHYLNVNSLFGLSFPSCLIGIAPAICQQLSESIIYTRCGQYVLKSIGKGA